MERLKQVNQRCRIYIIFNFQYCSNDDIKCPNLDSLIQISIFTLNFNFISSLIHMNNYFISKEQHRLFSLYHYIQFKLRFTSMIFLKQNPQSSIYRKDYLKLYFIHKVHMIFIYSCQQNKTFAIINYVVNNCAILQVIHAHLNMGARKHKFINIVLFNNVEYKINKIQLYFI